LVVLLPPEPGPSGQRVSPMFILMSTGRRPSSSAATQAIAVRKPVPMSCAPENTSALPSWWTRTSANTPRSRAFTYQLPLATPMPRFLGPGVSPGLRLQRSHPISLAPMSYCSRRTGEDSFLRRSSSGSIPSL
jgi:hypothetical protein